MCLSSFHSSFPNKSMPFSQAEHLFWLVSSPKYWEVFLYLWRKRQLHFCSLLILWRNEGELVSFIFIQLNQTFIQTIFKHEFTKRKKSRSSSTHSTVDRVAQEVQARRTKSQETHRNPAETIEQSSESRNRGDEICPVSRTKIRQENNRHSNWKLSPMEEEQIKFVNREEVINFQRPG